MSAPDEPDWDPRDPAVLDDQLVAYDALRDACPVAHSDHLGWSVFRHADALRVLEDHDTFSSQVSRHVSVPNGMDPPEHTRYRALIDPYFAPERLAAYEPVFRAIAAELVAGLVDGGTELMEELAHPFALRVTCAFMGWPQRLHDPLRSWIQRSQAATLAQDRDRLAQIAIEFDGYIREQLDERRRTGAAAPADATTALLREETDQGPLSDEQLVSLIRNWTVGELGTIAASVGIVAHHLASEPLLQEQLRADPGKLPAVIDEILRLDGPLVANRRVATRTVELAGRRIDAGEQVTIMWPSVDRDEAVFGPGVFDPEGHADDNLLYGAGIHVCPGAPLARLELRVLAEELLAGTRSLARARDATPTRARYPAGGFSRVPVEVVGSGSRR